MPRTIDFWFDFASTYSFLTAKRIDQLASEQHVTVRWRPFLLGPIFQAQGWTSSPFNIYPAKGRYMVRDMRRIAATRGHEFAMPAPFPQRSMTAARVALAVSEVGGAEQCAAFSKSVFEAQFEQARQLDDKLMLVEKIQDLGLDSQHVIGLAEGPGIKALLRSETEAAMALGIFGAPAFIASDGELFWGDDRLRQAVRHAALV